MKKLFYAALFSIGAFLLFLAPAAVNAFSVNYDTAPITLPDGSNVPLTDRYSTSSKGTDEVSFGVRYDAPGTTYTGVFTLSDTTSDLAPMLLISGGLIQSYTYDATTHQATIVWIGDQFIIPGTSNPSNESAFVFIPTTADPTPQNPQTSGPPASMAGGYVYTNVTDWQISPPTSSRQMGFGLTLNGPAGLKGYYTIKMPSAMLTLMSIMSGRTVTADDLALFIDGQQATIDKTITAANDVIFDIDLTFTTGDTNTSAAKTVSKTVMAQEREKLSAALTKSIVKKNKKTKLYGWLAKGKKGKSVKIYSKKKGEKEFNLTDTVKTKNKKGLYSCIVKHVETGTYFYKAVVGKTKSDKVKLKVKK